MRKLRASGLWTRRCICERNQAMREAKLIRYSCLTAALLTLLYWTIVQAQYPVMEAIANKVVRKYQQASCEQLANKKNEPKKPEEQKFIEALRNDPQMRTAFINKVAGPVVNKMFDCGLIP